MSLPQEARRQLFNKYSETIKRQVQAQESCHWRAIKPHSTNANKEFGKTLQLALYVGNGSGLRSYLEKLDIPFTKTSTLENTPYIESNDSCIEEFLRECQILGETRRLEDEIIKTRAELIKTEDPHKTGGIRNGVWAMILIILTIFTLTITPPAKRLVDHVISSKPSIAANDSIHAPTSAQLSSENIKKLSDDINILKSIIEIEARLDDTYSTVEAVGLSAGLFGVLITIITIFFALKESERVKDALNRINELEALFKSFDTIKRQAASARDDARYAEEKANRAREQANAAENTALEAESIAKSAKHTAQKANTTAQEANTTAQEANTTAQEANTTAKQAETTAEQVQYETKHKSELFKVPNFGEIKEKIQELEIPTEKGENNEIVINRKKLSTDHVNALKGIIPGFNLYDTNNNKYTHVHIKPN